MKGEQLHEMMTEIKIFATKQKCSNSTKKIKQYRKKMGTTSKPNDKIKNTQANAAVPTQWKKRRGQST